MMWLLWAVVRMAPQKDPGDAADLEAVRRMADGDGQALATLYDRHSRVTYSLALRILAEPLEAEEVVQDVFSQAWRQAARFDRSRGAVVAWLLMMTRSRAIDRVRARRAMPASAGDPDKAFGLIPDAADGPERVALTTRARRPAEGSARHAPADPAGADRAGVFRGVDARRGVGAAGSAARDDQDADQAGADEDEGRVPGRRIVSAADREQLRELASLHALGVLSDEERAELAKAMAGDAELAAEVRQLEDTAGALGGVVAQVDPPARLRARVLAVAGIEADDASGTPAVALAAAARGADAPVVVRTNRARFPAGWRPPPRSSWRPAWACGRCSSARRSTP